MIKKNGKYFFVPRGTPLPRDAYMTAIKTCVHIFMSLSYFSFCFHSTSPLLISPHLVLSNRHPSLLSNLFLPSVCRHSALLPYLCVAVAVAAAAVLPCQTGLLFTARGSPAARRPGRTPPVGRIVFHAPELFRIDLHSAGGGRPAPARCWARTADRPPLSPAVQHHPPRPNGNPGAAEARRQVIVMGVSYWVV